ncbi:enoyl-CoA hydratase-related protein [Paracoccus zhejiangensis]|uniref:2-(1,2-epoxy-1,2-dihydrophenyl)acetyl-CoA isomerase n=1 Tax=Paracoccus zhejiangensis TaxID=1077935 RepID=A0A2H5EXB1_9RHOB|nr:enoyl-CoA hydratase-related protein [Paracoccus zhejiangensis]AUH63946.1 2-(1,2-epoxy-1,2-dihydrophenyl)acetyl-CoA isomerase [Paracoccus zhejiangensis]
MSFETIQFSVRDGIATVVMNRPDVMNALNSRMRSEITAAISGVGAEVRCVVLTGSGRAFCSGQDLTDFAAAADVEAVLRDEYEPMLQAIVNCPVPVIAAINGVAAGAGANLALCCDVVIATESAQIIEAFTRIGLIPDAGGTWFIPRLVGHARAMGMMLFAEGVPAKQAEEWGLIWKALPDEEFVEGVAAAARKLAAGPSGAYRRIRTLVSQSLDNDLEDQLKLEARMQKEAANSRDFSEGVQAFLQKRPAQFSGR